jgi:hypothetical protein
VIAIEFLLVLGLFAALFMVMLGLGRMMNLKQQSMHAARYAAFAHAVTEAPTLAKAVRQAVGDDSASWSLVRDGQGIDPGDLLGKTSGAISSLLGRAVGGSGDVQARYTATGRAGEALLYGLDDIPAVHGYTLPVGYWNNNRCGVLSGLLESLGGPIL